jgi:hypothetical protein
MIVLRAAVSQWKRSRMGSCPIGPAASPPAQISGIVARCARIAGRSTAGSSARRRASSNSIRASRKESAGHETMTPTLMNSSRSTRGTTRITA